jgi:hypothetical protein
MSPSVAATVELNPSDTAHFSVHARAEPGVMPRILDLFAKRGLVPQRWHSAIAGSGMNLTIDIEIGGLGHDRVEYVAACMRRIAGVDLVLVV